MNEDIYRMYLKYGKSSLRIEIIHEVNMSDAEIELFEEEIINQYKQTHTILNRVHNETFQGGRPKNKVQDNFEQIYNDWKSKRIKSGEAMRLSGLSPGSFYRRIREWKACRKEIRSTKKALNVVNKNIAIISYIIVENNTFRKFYTHM